jgi:hypothetical protein
MVWRGINSADRYQGKVGERLEGRDSNDTLFGTNIFNEGGNDNDYLSALDGGDKIELYSNDVFQYKLGSEFGKTTIGVTIGGKTSELALIDNFSISDVRGSIEWISAGLD